jgi:hypothetical protein
MAVWVDEYDFSSAISEVDVVIETPEAGRTSLASAAEEFRPLLPKISVTQNGYFEGVLPGGFEDEMEARFGVGGAVVTVLTDNLDADCAAYVLPDASGYEMAIKTPMNGLITLNGKWGTSGNWRRGLRVFDGTFDDVENGATVDFGAGVTDGGAAYLHVASITGTATNATIEVESSADNVSFVSEGTFAFSSVDGLTLALSGAISRYVRLACTDLGGATAVRCMGVVSLGA